MQTNAAVAEPMVEKMKKRNETSAADRIRSYQDQVYLHFLRLVQQLLRLQS